jgi:hypothetical protein
MSVGGPVIFQRPLGGDFGATPISSFLKNRTTNMVPTATAVSLQEHFSEITKQTWLKQTY